MIFFIVKISESMMVQKLVSAHVDTLTLPSNMQQSDIEVPLNMQHSQVSEDMSLVNRKHHHHSYKSHLPSFVINRHSHGQMTPVNMQPIQPESVEPNVPSNMQPIQHESAEPNVPSNMQDSEINEQAVPSNMQDESNEEQAPSNMQNSATD